MRVSSDQNWGYHGNFKMFGIRPHADFAMATSEIPHMTAQLLRLKTISTVLPKATT